jgi:hypothetical protein
MNAIALRYFHDDDFEVFVNGEPLFTRQGYTAEYQDVSLAPDQVALFHPGENVIAIHCWNSHAAQYVDIGLTYEAVGEEPAHEAGGTPPTNGVNTATSPQQVAQTEERILQTTSS